VALENTSLIGPSGSDGRFLLPGLDAGTYVLRVTHPGYQDRTDTVVVSAGTVTEVLVPLSANPIQLAPIRVTVRSLVLQRQGFYERRSQGYAGTYFTREDIEERDARDVTDLLRDVPGVRVLPGGIAGARIVLQRAINVSDSGVCEPSIFMDGVKSQIRLFDLILDPVHLEGIEVYVGAGVPGKFNDPCGAVLIWTRVP